MVILQKMKTRPIGTKMVSLRSEKNTTLKGITPVDKKLTRRSSAPNTYKILDHSKWNTNLNSPNKFLSPKHRQISENWWKSVRKKIKMVMWKRNPSFRKQNHYKFLCKWLSSKNNPSHLRLKNPNVNYRTRPKTLNAIQPSRYLSMLLLILQISPNRKGRANLPSKWWTNNENQPKICFN